MNTVKKNLKKADYFNPIDWLDGLDDLDFDVDWIKKSSDPKKPQVKKNILKTIIASVVILGVLNRRETKTQVNTVLKNYSKRAKTIAKESERIGQEALRTLSQMGEKDLKRIVENELVYSAGQVNIDAHQGQRYIWRETTSENPDPYHLTLVGQEFAWNEGDKDGNRPCERYGCKCSIEWIDN